MRHLPAAIAALCLLSSSAFAASLPAATAGQVVAQAKAAQAGDDVVLTTSGDYGLLKFYQVNKTAEVVIRPAEGVAARVAISTQASSNLTFRDLEVVGIAGGTGAALSGTNIRLETSYVHAAPVYSGSGVFVRNCTGCAVVGNRIRQTYSGISHLDNNRLLIDGNDIRDINGDGIRGGGSNFLTISNNFGTDLHRVDANHTDWVQNWTTNTTAGVTDFTISGNTYIRGLAGSAAQCIFLGNEKHFDYVNLVVRGNACIGGMWHGISVYNALNPLISGNLVYGWNDSIASDGQIMKPWIMLTACKGATWGDNRSTRFSSTGCDPVPTPTTTNTAAVMTAPGDLTQFEAWKHRNDPPVAPASIDDQLAAAQAAIAELQGQVADLKAQLAALASERDAALAGAAVAEAQLATTQAGLQAAAAARDAALARIAAGIAALAP